ncbi:hypothetical protein [Piscirickettsia salmonis]|uniref:hypothetical protein n=1 Tax=Piscirickettsia salmonis TaxID=1238 RepID=UPI0007C94250|nr:hypothetical protein A0O36_00764 [Piscirickettsiaceae bacterium NZ-RLO1]
MPTIEERAITTLRKLQKVKCLINKPLVKISDISTIDKIIDDMPHDRLKNKKKSTPSSKVIQSIYYDLSTGIDFKQKINKKIELLQLYAKMVLTNRVGKNQDSQFFQNLEKAFKKVNIITASKRDIIQILDQKKDPQLPPETSTIIADYVMEQYNEPVSLSKSNKLGV